MKFPFLLFIDSDFSHNKMVKLKNDYHHSDFFSENPYAFLICKALFVQGNIPFSMNQRNSSSNIILV